jgi:hypothetical protein
LLVDPREAAPYRGAEAVDHGADVQEVDNQGAHHTTNTLSSQFLASREG